MGTRDLRPEGAGIYIRQIPSAHVIINIFHFRHSKNLPKVDLNISASLSRLTIVSREAKKKQAVHDERVSYLHVAPL